MGIGSGPVAGDDDALKSLLAAIVESSSDAIIAKTLDGVITSWNGGAVDIYGYAAREMIGHNVSELMPPDRAGELVPILERVRQGQRVENFETRRLRKDGAVIDVSVSVCPLRDAGGAVIGAATVTGILPSGPWRRRSGRRATPGCIRRSGWRRWASWRAGSRMISTTCCPRSWATRGWWRIRWGGDPAVRADVEQILSTAQRAAALTKELLMFSRREPGEPQDLDLNEVVAGVRSMLAVSVGEHIEVRVDPGVGAPAGGAH